MSEQASPEAAKRSQISSWLQKHEEQIANAIAELVAIPTENPPGENYGACADALERMLREAGLDVARFRCDAAEGKGEAADSLLATCGGGERSLYFHGHYDVVPAQSREQFAPRREGNFLFGRGTCDMKGGIVAMLYAIRALQETGANLRGKIALMLVPDEETGGARGSAWLAKQGLLGRRGIGMLTAEPTSGAVWNANRGAITLRIRILGKPAHVGLQHQGENAFERMHEVVGRLRRLKREVEQRTTKYNAGSEPARHSILLIGGQSGGGSNFNVVPAESWFTVDRRINPEEDLAVEKQRICDVLEGSRREGIPLEWEILQEGASASASEDDPLAQALGRSTRRITGKTPKFELCPGLLETRFYAAQGIPAYAYGPGLLTVAHGPNEYVDLRKVAEAAEIYAATAMELLG